MIDLSHVTALASFLTGLLTFFAPCTFITLPTFLTYLVNRGVDKTPPLRRFHLLLSVIFFALGFLVIFFPIGFTITQFGIFITQYSSVAIRFGGLLILLFGLFILVGEPLARKFKVLRFTFYEYKVSIDPATLGGGYTLPFVIGITTAFAWTACQGPILGGIITLISIGSTQSIEGTVYLVLYWLGIMIPYVIAALTIEWSSVYIKKIAKYTPAIHTATAVLLIAIGILLILGINNVTLDFYEYFGYTPQ